MSTMKTKQDKAIIKNQDGFASIVIALVLIIVLGLLTVGYAELARKEQSTALNKQLSDQAYYAAESGVNAAYRLIQTDPSGIANASGVNTNNCLPQSTFNNANNGILNSTDDVSFQCVLVQLNPPTLYADIPAEQSWNTVFQTTVQGTNTPSAALRSIRIFWGSADGHDAAAPSPGPSGANPGYYNVQDLPTQAAWGGAAPLLQLTITAITSPTSITRTSLINHSFTYYLYPNIAGGACDSGPQVNGQIYCAENVGEGYGYGVQLEALTDQARGPGASNTFLVHVTSYYDAARVELTSAADDPVNFEGSQADVDVTGKAKDVLRRIFEAVPLNSVNGVPTFAIEAQNICKQFQTEPDSSVDGGLGSSPENPYNVPIASSSANPCDTDY